MAAGSFVAHWDDDDWSRADRLESQLREQPTVTGFRQMLFWHEPTGTGSLYSGSRNYVIGTSLLYRRDWWQAHKFPHRDLGEDNAFVRTAHTAGALRVEEGYGLMVATTHKNGTSPRGHCEKYLPVERAAIPEDYWIL